MQFERGQELASAVSVATDRTWPEKKREVIEAMAHQFGTTPRR